MDGERLFWKNAAANLAAAASSSVDGTGTQYSRFFLMPGSGIG
jgi:hypothetical protein